ncbi:hypothetical protein KY309_01505 [Candidatus Woesearchaeota archaeon]|nr:hypothetical protein [Candidatus Woesearchaeota archaeon]MBW3016266.1 hypothetical protein [Candidatus Woesearchaeota archaeon]
MKHIRYAWDQLFLFMLIVSVTLFVVGLKVEIDKEAIHIIEGIDMTILGGYYYFFLHGFKNSKKKIQYCKKHWVMLLLLTAPLIPVARLAKIARIERVFAIGTNTMWHVLDQLGLL